MPGGSSAVRPALETAPVWSPDDKQIAFASERDGGRNLYRKASSNVSNEELLFKSDQPKTPTDWFHDMLLFESQDPKNGTDILVLTGAGGAPADVKVTPYLNTQFNERQARVSPDGRFVAYTSDAANISEVYVQTFPDPKGGRWPISQGGGQFPHWSRDGKELFYTVGAAGGVVPRMMSVAVTLSPQFKAGIPKVLFPVPPGSNAFDVTGNGQQFIKLAVASATSDAQPASINVVLNWAAGLRK